MSKKKILIVDDEKDVLVVLGERLSWEGYLVVKADNGNEAINIAKTEKPDLIILDILMPRMDGTEIAMKLKEDIDTKDIPVIFLTCLVSKKEEDIANKKIGDNIIIAKPYNPQELLAEVKKQIGGGQRE